MGFFGGYDKPGKGVDKNAPKKKGFFLYWDIIIGKFMKFIQVNSMYSVISLVWIILMYLAAMVLFSGHMSSLTGLASQIDGVSSENIAGAMVFGFCAMFAAAVFLLWGSGPASAAYSYIMRCYTRGEHAWIMSDGKDKFKENFKQGMLVLLIDFIIMLFGINALYFYYSAYAAYGSLLWMVLCYVTFLLLLLYTMIHPYLYQLMVTFECSFASLYRSAILLTLAKLPMNLLLTVIEAALIFAVFMLLSPAVAILFSLILGPCIMRFPSEFYAARVIERSVLRDMKKKSLKAEITYLEDDEV